MFFHLLIYNAYVLYADIYMAFLCSTKWIFHAATVKLSYYSKFCVVLFLA